MEKYLINPNHTLSKINRDIYGVFSEHLGRCIYEGTYVGEGSPIENVNGMRTDVVNALKQMKVPVLRWPGGCFADEYHWKDGIGVKSERKKMINTHWGGLVEDNSFGTHEFFELCRQLGCAAYINGNVGSGTVREMGEWVEYMTFDGLSPMSELRAKNGRKQPWEIKYFGIGNENWGCGGNMLPEHYANEYRRFNTYVRDYIRGKHINRVACGPNAFDYNWTRVMMEKAASRIENLSLHYYTIPGDWGKKGSALEFSDEEYYTTLKKACKMDELCTRHGQIMDMYDPEKRIGLIVDEWGTWYDVEPGTNPGFLYQQNTVRDALVAGITLNIFNKHSDRVRMANLAQTVNVLQAVILTDGEKMLLTPTYHVMKMYADHQDAVLLSSHITTKQLEDGLPQLIESASVDERGVITATIVNTSLSEQAQIRCQVADFAVGEVSAQIITGESSSHNTFDEPDRVCSKVYCDIEKTADGFILNAPACSVIKVKIRP